MTQLIAKALYPCAVVLAVALLLRGYQTVGDGFSAGAVAAVGAIIQYVSFEHEKAAHRVRARASFRLISFGLSLTLAVALLPVLFGKAPVTHFPRPQELVIHLGAVELHTALLFDLGIAFAVYGGLVAVFDKVFPFQEEFQKETDE